MHININKNIISGNRMARLLAIFAFTTATVAAQAVDYFQRIAMEGVELVTAVTWGKVDEFTVMNPGYYVFSYDNKFAPNKTQPLFQAKALGGCAYHDGKIYSNEFNSHDQYVKPVWRIYDAHTFELLSEHTLKDNCESTTTSLAYDQTTNKIYGFNETYTETYVVSVDPETGEMTRLGNMLDRNYKFFAMACSPTGELYCTYLNKNTDAVYLGKVRKSDGKVAMIRGIAATNLLPGDSFINSAYDQAMFYNNATGKLYWMFQSSSMLLYKEYTALFEVNPVTAEAVMVSYIEDALQGPGAFLMEPSMKAPAIISNFKWTPDTPGSQSGTMTFDIPAEAYDGSQLSGNQQVTVTSGDNTLASASMTPGQTFTKHLDNLPTGWQYFKIHVANAAGDGPTVERKEFIGFDTPKAPTNVKLTSEGLHTTLTWTAPTEGIYGKTINADQLTYNVVRYPGEETVKEGLKECRFEEDHPADMTRYVYRVTAVADGVTGRSALSNNLIVGTPLDVPFGGMFTDAADMYNYYTILDSNGDGVTWLYDADGTRAYYGYNEAQGGDDWLITPPINYQAGKTYRLTFNAISSSSSYRESMQVTFGSDKTPEAQSNVLLDLPVVPALSDLDAPDGYSVEVTVPTDGVYYFGFHATSEKFREYLFVDNIKIVDANASGIGSIAAAASANVVAGKGTLSVQTPAAAAITVSSASGKVVACTFGKQLNATLPSGVYLVTTNGKTVKAVVK